MVTTKKRWNQSTNFSGSPQVQFARLEKPVGSRPGPFFYSNKLLALAVCAALLAGCAPPGQRALLKGDRLIQQGDFANAVPKMEEATRLLAHDSFQIQAQAWNLLGLAYHNTDQPIRSRQAYRQALKLDHNLAVASYNLGCLELEQKNYQAAIDALTTCTFQRPKDANV